MAEARMLTIFCYDIASDRVRRRVSAVLEDWGVRVQDSVFEARLTAAQAESLAEEAAALLGTDDSLRVYAVGKGGLPRCRQFGAGPPLLDGRPFTVI